MNGFAAILPKDYEGEPNGYHRIENCARCDKPHERGSFYCEEHRRLARWDAVGRYNSK